MKHSRNAYQKLYFLNDTLNYSSEFCATHLASYLEIFTVNRHFLLKNVTISKRSLKTICLFVIFCYFTTRFKSGFKMDVKIMAGSGF